MTLPSRSLGYSNNQLKAVNMLKDSFRLSETIDSESLKLTFNLKNKHIKSDK